MNPRLRPRLRFDGFELDPARRRLLRDGEPVALRPKAFLLLSLLVHHAERVVTKEELLTALWPEGHGTEANLTVNVAAVRRALGEHAREHRYVITVPTVGYRFAGEVRPVFGRDDERPGEEIERLGILPFSWIDGTGGRHAAGAATVEHSRPDHGPLTETIIRSLSHLPRLDVVPIASEKRDDPEGIEHGVDTVLEGEIHRENGDLRIELGIWNLPERQRIWGQRLLHPAREEHALPLRVTRTLIHALRPRAPRRVGRHTSGNGTSRQPAADHVAQGRRSFWRGDMTRGLWMALEAYERAAGIDPSDAVAQAGISEVLLELWSTGIAFGREVRDRSRAAAVRAVELDPLLSEAHRALGMVRLYLDLDWAAGREHLLAALDFGPHDAAAYNRYARYLACRAQYEAAVENMVRATELDPTSTRMTADLALMYYSAGDLHRALAVLDDLMAHEPDSSLARTMSAWFRLGLGSPAEALPLLEKLVTVLGERPLTDAVIGAGHAAVGDDTLADHFEQKLGAARDRGLVFPSSFFAMIPAARGDVPEAVRHLTAALDEGDGHLARLRADAFWRPVLDHPAASDLRRRIYG